MTFNSNKMRIDPETARRLGVPEFIEPWHFNLIYASRDPVAYADVLTDQEPAALYDCFETWQSLLDHAVHDITQFVPERLRGEFTGMVERAQTIVAVELVSRGLSLPDTQHQVH